MTPLLKPIPTYQGPRTLGFSKYASPAHTTPAHAAPAHAAPAHAAPDTAIVAKEQIIAMRPKLEVKGPAIKLAMAQDAALQEQLEEHTTKLTKTVSSAVTNTRQLLNLLRESTPGSEVVDNLWQELEQLFRAANSAQAALPEFMEMQRDNMNLFNSSMMNETMRETHAELNLQHKKVNKQYNLILEQQNAFQKYKKQTTVKLEQLQSLQERVSRLTLEKGNFRTEVDKYKELLQRETESKAEELKIADALQKELQTLVSSKQQLQAEVGTLRNRITDLLEQLKKKEQMVTDRFVKELQARSEDLKKESIKVTSLNALVNTLKTTENSTQKELDKIKTERCLLSVKYDNQASEHAAAFTKMNDQRKKIEVLMAKVDALESQNKDLQAQAEKASESAKAVPMLLKAKEDFIKQIDTLDSQLNDAKDNAKAAHAEMQKAKTELANTHAKLVTGNEDALLEKVKELEKTKSILEGSLAEWSELAKRSYKEYKDMLPTYKEAEKIRREAGEKELQITNLEHQLATMKASQSNSVDATGGDSAYWKQKYETLLSTIG